MRPAFFRGIVGARVVAVVEVAIEARIAAVAVVRRGCRCRRVLRAQTAPAVTIVLFLQPLAVVEPGPAFAIARVASLRAVGRLLGGAAGGKGTALRGGRRERHDERADDDDDGTAAVAVAFSARLEHRHCGCAPPANSVFIGTPWTGPEASTNEASAVLISQLSVPLSAARQAIHARTHTMVLGVHVCVDVVHMSLRTRSTPTRVSLRR